jgi:hypothetical protein
VEGDMIQAVTQNHFTAVDLLRMLNIGFLGWGKTYAELAGELVKYYKEIHQYAGESHGFTDCVYTLSAPDVWIAVTDKNANGDFLQEGEMEKIFNLFRHLNSGGKVILNCSSDMITNYGCDYIYEDNKLKWEDIEFVFPAKVSAA